MVDETNEWESITIRYLNRPEITIRKEYLDKIESMGDVIDALQHAKTLVGQVKDILK